MSDVLEFNCDVSFLVVGPNHKVTVNQDTYLVSDCVDHPGDLISIVVANNNEFLGFVCTHCTNKLEAEICHEH